MGALPVELVVDNLHCLDDILNLIFLDPIIELLHLKHLALTPLALPFEVMPE